MQKACNRFFSTQINQEKVPDWLGTFPCLFIFSDPVLRILGQMEKMPAPSVVVHA